MALASCGGGGGGSAALPPAKTPVQPGGGTAQLRLTIPTVPGGGASRRRNFVSPGATGVGVAAGPHGGTQTTTAFDISAGSALCTPGTSARTCNLNVVVPFGNDDFTVTLYDTAPFAGKIPASAHVLGTATVTQSIALGVPTTVSLIEQGVIAGLGTIAPLITVPGDGNTYTQTVMFNPVDFSNQPITAGTNDPYSNPITVTLSETGGVGQTQLTLNGTPVGASTTLTQSSQTLGIKYLGAASPGYYATVTLGATGITSASFDVAPMFVRSTSPLFAVALLSFTGAAQSANFTVSEARGSNTYNAVGPVSAGCASAATVGSATGSGASGAFTISSLTGAVSGGCGVTVSDSANTAVTINYTNTVTSGGVTIGGITEYPTPLTAPNLIVSGADGNLYVGSNTGASIWVYDTSGVQAGWYNVQVPAQAPVSMANGPDGFVWYVGDATQVFHNTSILTSGCCTQFSPSGASKLNAITLGPDGNMWMTDNTTNQAFDLTPFGVVAATYSVTASPTLIASQASPAIVWVVSPGVTSTLSQIILGSNPLSISIPNSSVGPAAMTVDAAGNVWIAEQTENQIDEYNGGWHQYPIGANDGPAGIAVGADGNIWFTAPTSNSIGQFNVTTHTFTHYSIPTASADPSAITLGHDGRMWFTESAVGKMGAITP